MKRIGGVLILIMFFSLVKAEKVTIHGKAKGYEGNRVSIITYKDYISKLPNIIAETKVKEDGTFEVSCDLDEIEYARLKVNHSTSIIYLQPGANYYVTFPIPSKKDIQTLDDIDVDMYFDSLDVLDINNLILDFDYRFDYFVSKYRLILNKPEFKFQIDTFKQKITHAYREVKNPWFINYVYYSTAQLEMISDLEEAEGMGRVYVYDQYIKAKHIDYNHDKYMQLFNQFYYEPFSIVSAQLEEKIAYAINTKASMKLLSKAFEKSTFTYEQNIRELVLIKGLMENYHNINYDKEHILIILDSLSNFAHLEENRQVAKNVYEKLTYLTKGSAAPDFKLLNLKGDTISLSQFKGQFIYLGFWSTWNTTSLSELKLYPGYKKRYGESIVYISVNMDEKKEDFENYMKEHPDYDWYFLDGNSLDNVSEIYNLKAIPSYFLIDEEGKLRQSPALRPLPSGTFKSIDETLHNIYWNKKRRGDKNYHQE